MLAPLLDRFTAYAKATRDFAIHETHPIKAMGRRLVQNLVARRRRVSLKAQASAMSVGPRGTSTQAIRNLRVGQARGIEATYLVHHVARGCGAWVQKQFGNGVCLWE